MKSTIIAVLFVLPCVVPAQTVNGPGDDVLCGGYTPIHLFRASDLSTVNRRIPPPFPLFAETGKPFSARHVSQDLQVRADGTRICGVPLVTVIYRDSAGRRREETSFSLEGPDGKPAPMYVKITDPAAQIEYYLDMAAHVAYRMKPPLFSPMAHADGVPEPPNPAFTEKKESLGTHSYQGVDVEGRRITTTGTPPGSNAPISVTSELWIWPYLNTAVLNKSVNPASSRTDAWLNLSAAEPDPSLFRVPDGWKVVASEGSPSLAAGSAYRTAAGFRYSVTLAPPTHAEYRVVEAPYWADQEYERTSNLAGPKIPPATQSSKIYRDSAGRTRVDRPVLETGPVFPRIEDPVDDVEIVLDPVNRIAHRFTVPDTAANPPPHVAPRGFNLSNAAQESETELGEGTMEGLKVTGTLQTYRTAAGAGGNDRELTESTESWYSPDLRVIVLAKQDSETQRSVTRLTHISTMEPDPALFAIPDGYTVIDEKAPVTISVTQP